MLELLAEILQKDASNSSIVAQEGAVDPLLNLMMKGPPNLQPIASNILITLSLHQPKYVVQKRGIDKFIKIISSGSVLMKEKAIKALGNLAQQHIIEIVNAGAVKPLVKLLTSNVESLQLEVVYTLGKLACHADTREWIGKVGAIKPLVRLLSSSDSVVIKQAAAYSIWKLAFYNLNNSKEIIKEGAITPLVELMGLEEGCNSAACALKELVVLEQNKVVEAILKLNISLSKISNQELRDVITQHFEHHPLTVSAPPSTHLTPSDKPPFVHSKSEPAGLISAHKRKSSLTSILAWRPKIFGPPKSNNYNNNNTTTSTPQEEIPLPNLPQSPPPPTLPIDIAKFEIGIQEWDNDLNMNLKQVSYIY